MSDTDLVPGGGKNQRHEPRSGKFLEEPVTAELDGKAAALRVQGFTFAEIAAEMGCAVSTANDRVKRAMAAVRVASAAELVRTEDERLDALWKVAWREAFRNHLMVSHGKVVHITNDAGQSVPVIDHGPKLQALNTLLRISERRAKLHGLDAPVRHRVDVVTEDAIDAEIRRLEEEIARQDESAPAEG